jgi:hypothetical protein
LPVVGEWAIGAAIIIVTFLILARIGVGRWESWDAAERVAARKLVPEHVAGWRPALTFGLLTVVTLAMSVGTFALLWR